MKQKRKYRYIVEDQETGKYLGKQYYKGQEVDFYSEAYRFGAFELRLASAYLLRPKKRYRVYNEEIKK